MCCAWQFRSRTFLCPKTNQSIKCLIDLQNTRPDHPTALDSESEATVQAALDKLMAAKKRTTIVVAHRYVYVYVQWK